MNFILRMLLTAAVAFGLASVLPGIHIENFWTAIVVVFVLAILNILVKPVLIILTLPITLLTFGLFLFVINALIILLAGKFIDGFIVDGFWWALIFSLLLSVLSSLIFKERKSENRSD